MKKYFIFFVFVISYNVLIKAGGDETSMKQRALVCALLKKNNNSSIEKLLKENVSPDFVISDKTNLQYEGGVFWRTVFEKKMTPLMLAADMITVLHQENLELLQMLLDHGADPLAQDAKKKTVLDYVYKKDSDSYNLLKAAQDKLKN